MGGCGPAGARCFSYGGPVHERVPLRCGATIALWGRLCKGWLAAVVTVQLHWRGKAYSIIIQLPGLSVCVPTAPPPSAPRCPAPSQLQRSSFKRVCPSFAWRPWFTNAPQGVGLRSPHLLRSARLTRFARPILTRFARPTLTRFARPILTRPPIPTPRSLRMEIPCSSARAISSPCWGGSRSGKIHSPTAAPSHRH